MAKQWLKYKTEIYGLCAIWVILFHSSRRVGVPGNLPVITPFIIQGNAAVDVFMLLSGICGYLSFRNKTWKEYYIKRFIRVVIPYLIISMPFWFWKSLVEVPVNGHFNMKVFIKDITTISLWKEGTTTTWFVAAICLFYFLVPFFQWIINKGEKAFVGAIFIVYILNIIGIYFFPMYYYACLVWGRLPIFMIGYYIGKTLKVKKAELEAKKYRAFKAICFFVVFVGFVILQVGEADYGFSDNRGIVYLLYGLFAIPLAVVLTEMIKLISKLKFLSLFLNSFGKISLEIYMIHVFMIRWIAFYNGFDRLGYLSYLIIMVVSYIISYVVSKVIGAVSEKLVERIRL